MREQLDRIIEEIKRHPSWSKNVIMRYAYIALGRIVQKDTMFFYTIQNNLLSKEKDDLRYSRDEISRLINTPDLFDYKVVCRNSAEMLAYILNNCGVEAEVRKTLVAANYKGIIVNHYFVVATGDMDKKYFLTLNPDLPNIKLGRKTSKFAYEVKYRIDNDYIDGGGNFGKQYYEGDEVDFSVLSEAEIKELDRQIGYPDNLVMNSDGTVSNEYTDIFMEKLIEMYKNNSDYIDYVTHQTSFYEIISRLLNENKTLNEVLKEKPSLNKEDIYALDFKISDISDDVWEDVKTFILNSIISKIYKEYNVRSGTDFDALLADRNYSEISKTFSRELLTRVDTNETGKMGSLNPFFTMRKMVKLFGVIDVFIDNKNLSKEDYKKYKEQFGKCLSDVFVAFVDKKILPNEGSLSSTYLTNKIIYAFNSIFDIGMKTDFNEIGLAEQVAVIKELLEIILSDIKRDENLPNYNDQKSPLRNRIISTVLFEKETKSPYYLIYVKNTTYGDNANMIIVYDLTNNQLYLDKSPIDIMSDYYVIKDADMKLIIEEFASIPEVSDEDNFQL